MCARYCIPINGIRLIEL